MSDEDLDATLEELIHEGEQGRNIIVDHDIPNPLRCPNCDTVGDLVRDLLDSEKILCRPCGTHILTEMTAEEIKLVEQLQDMVWKLDNEGLSYFLFNYIDMVPSVPAIDGDGKTLRELADDARDALETFEHSTKAACKNHGIDYDPD